MSAVPCATSRHPKERTGDPAATSSVEARRLGNDGFLFQRCPVLSGRIRSLAAVQASNDPDRAPFGRPR